MLFWLGKSDERFKRERIRWSNISIQYGRKHLFKGSEVTKLIIPSYKKFLPLLHSFVAVNIEVFEISEILEKVELCTEEAFVYLLNNSYQDEAGEIEISISIDETDFILSFLNRGLPIDIILPDTFTAVD